MIANDGKQSDGPPGGLIGGASASPSKYIAFLDFQG